MRRCLLLLLVVSCSGGKPAPAEPPPQPPAPPDAGPPDAAPPAPPDAAPPAVAASDTCEQAIAAAVARWKSKDAEADVRGGIKWCQELDWPASVRACVAASADREAAIACVAAHYPPEKLKIKKETEAERELRRLYAGLRAYAAAKKALPKKGAGRTPQQSCCDSGGECAPAPAAWASGIWADLKFELDDTHQYVYEVEIVKPGKEIVLRATGNLDCDGDESVWEIRAKLPLPEQPVISSTDPLE